SLVSLRGLVIKAIGEATMGTANRTWSPRFLTVVQGDVAALTLRFPDPARCFRHPHSRAFLPRVVGERLGPQSSRRSSSRACALRRSSWSWVGASGDNVSSCCVTL